MDAAGRTSFYGTTVGKKVVMAITGVILAGFLVGHVLGNFELFGGPERINEYAHFLHHTAAPLLWTARVVLLASILLHIRETEQLYRLKARARPVPYQKKSNRGARIYSLIMLYSGIALALFIVYHILHFTTGTLHFDFIPDDVFHNVTSAFQHWWVALIYLVAMAFLAMHLNHGLWSMTQSIGISHPKYTAILKPLAVVVALLIAGGFALVPILVLGGLVR